MPAGFNLRSPQHVSRFLGSKKFTVNGKVLKEVNELDKTLDALAGVPGQDEGYETNYDDVPSGTFVTLKEGRKWDHGVWVVDGHGTGEVDTPLRYGVSRPELMDSLTLSQDPWVQDYLEYKKYDKLLGTYLDTFPIRARNGRLYGRFNQTGTATGRLSSSEPNLQNIPSRAGTGAEVRELFQGNLVVGDFSQLEPRLMAHFSQDPYMVTAFMQGKDLYQDIAHRVNCTRDVAKTLVLAMSYGAGAEKVAKTLRLNGHAFSTQQAKQLITDLQKAYGVYFAWREKVIAESRRTGSVSTIDGRLRRLQFGSDSAAAWKDPSAPGRQAANAIVQGSAADVVRRVMLHTTRMFPELKLLAQVHDELVWEYDPAHYTPDLQHLEKWVLGIAQRGISVPLVFKPHMGTSWYRAKEGI
jgi:DNA polymerase-1